MKTIIFFKYCLTLPPHALATQRLQLAGADRYSQERDENKPKLTSCAIVIGPQTKVLPKNFDQAGLTAYNIR